MIDQNGTYATGFRITTLVSNQHYACEHKGKWDAVNNICSFEECHNPFKPISLTENVLIDCPSDDDVCPEDLECSCYGSCISLDEPNNYCPQTF